MKRMADLIASNTRNLLGAFGLEFPEKAKDRDAFIGKAGGWLLSWSAARSPALATSNGSAGQSTPILLADRKKGSERSMTQNPRRCRKAPRHGVRRAKRDGLLCLIWSRIVVKCKNEITFLDHCSSMSDRNDDHVILSGPQMIKYVSFGIGIQCRAGFVKQQDFWA
ncbi:hypothetical protein SAMN05216328_1708 [Ensifer sp. YR511]|nr:hypothetical protein SAMN05216328_1708 [Ensifer sp. YR511]